MSLNNLHPSQQTILPNIFPSYRYVNLEDPEIWQWAISQPRDFLKNNSWPLIIDEAQHAPDLFSYIQIATDEHDEAGMYLLCGSQNFLLMEKISQSLAGRSAILTYSIQTLKQSDEVRHPNPDCR
ncbi:MAG: AAA family ATPase [Bacteroidota bacterium]